MNIKTLTALAAVPADLAKMTKKELIDVHYYIVEDHGSDAAYTYSDAFEKTGKTAEKLTKANLVTALKGWARNETKPATKNGKKNGKTKKTIDFGESAKTGRPCPARKDKMETKGLSQFTEKELRDRYKLLCGRDASDVSLHYVKQSIYKFVKMLRNNEDPTVVKLRRRSDGLKTKPYSMPLTDPMREALDAVAEKEEVSTAAFVRGAVLAAMKKAKAKGADLFDDSKR